MSQTTLHKKQRSNKSKHQRSTKVFFLWCFFITCILAFILNPDKSSIAEQVQQIPNKIQIVYVQKHIEKKVNQEELLCLAENIFWEASGTDKAEKQRVANVTVNRLFSDLDGYEDKQICEVVYKPKQFSWTHQGKNRKVLQKWIKSNDNKKAWDDSVKIAELALKNELPDITRGALFYHTKKIKPNWDYSKIKPTVNGPYHIYYKMKT